MVPRGGVGPWGGAGRARVPKARDAVHTSAATQVRGHPRTRDAFFPPTHAPSGAALDPA